MSSTTTVQNAVSLTGLLADSGKQTKAFSTRKR